MQNWGGGRVLVAGVAGIIVGALAEAWINSLVGATVVTDGMLWGAVLGILIASVPNFSRMGALTVKSDKPAVNLLMGLGLFVVISAVIILLFLGLFSLLGRLLL